MILIKLKSMFALLLLWSCAVVKAQNYGRHGLFWSGLPNFNASISENTNWQTIPGATLVMALDSEKKTLISYEISVEGLRKIDGSPLPRESNTDSLQVRCVVDGIPLRHSSSVATTYLVEQRMISTLSSTFAASMSAENHTISLQWKKTGTQLEKWIVQTGGVSSKFTIAAQADFDAIDFMHESKDEFIFTPDVWKPLSNNLTFHVNKERVVTIGYAFTVQPQLVSFVKDRTMEYLMARLSVDGTAFVESAETFGTNGWNPQSHVLKGSVRLKLGAGEHVAELLWRKRGNIFKSWGSNPSSMDGFASSRNLYVLMEKFDPPTFVDHERHISPATNQWATVGQPGKNVLTFHLIKESAVLLTYALPVTQHENPNFDSNSWEPLAAIDARLVVDDVAYTFQGGDSVRRGSREFSDLFGNLALVLPAGSHSVSLQWRSDGVRWTTLNDLDGGFSHGEKLLAFVTSENALPVITSPETVVGYEDVVLVVPGVRIDDIDDQLAGGVTLDVNVTVSTGILGMPNAALLANPVEYTFGVDHSTIRMTDSIANINAALLDLTYTSPRFWNGEDSIVISTSDQSQTGFGSAPNTDSATIKIVIRPVDNMFTLDVSPVQTLPNVGANQALAAITLTDIDSQEADFRVQLSATCGVLSLQVLADAHVTFYAGDGVNDTAVDFQGPYSTVRGVLLNVLYSPDSSCNQAVHQESLTVRVTDVRNPAHDITRLISINTIRQNAAPEILSRANPRWTIDGLLLESTADTEGAAAVSYTQYPANIKASLDLTKSPLVLGNQNEVAALSELSVLHTDNVTYALSLQYQNFTQVALVGSNYILSNAQKHVVFSVAGGIAAEITSAQCIFSAVASPAEIDREAKTVSCVLQHSEGSSATVDSDRKPIEWVKVAFSDAHSVLLESNYLPIFVSQLLRLLSAAPLSVLPRGRAVVRIQASAPGVVQVCLFDDHQVSAVVQNGEVLCKMPDLGERSTARSLQLRIASVDLHFQSESVTLSLMTVPTLTSAHIATNSFTKAKSLVVEGVWKYEVIEASASVYCVLDNGMQVLASSTGTTEVHCPLTDRSMDARDHLTVSLRFGEQVTNTVPVVPQANEADIDIFVEFDIRDTFADSAVESGYLTIIGDFRYVPVGKDISCVFGGAEKSAPIIVDDFTVLCPIPPGSSGSFALGNQVLLEDFASALGIVKVPVVDHFSPLLGSASGGQEVSVFGTGFGVNAEVTCRFGEVSVPALIVSETHISCVAPMHHPGAVTLNVLVDDVYAMAAAPQVFTYTTDPTVISTAPSAGPLSGGTEVLVSGSGFQSSDAALRCHFGNISVPAQVESETQVSCRSPVASESGSVTFTVRSSNRLHAASAATFRYLDPIALSAVYPDHGAVGAETIVLVYGAGFVPQAGTMCLFGSTGVTARVISSNVIECAAPAALSADTVDVGVSIDGYVQETGKLSFTYQDATLLTSVSPVFGPPHGGTNVTVLGAGFQAASSIECQFGETRVPASRLSDTAVACTAPANNVSVVEVGLLIDHKLVQATESLEFNYVRSPAVTAVVPAAGAVAGGTVASVTGTGFSSPSLKSIDWDVYCQFGDKTTIAAVQSDTELTCLAPAAAIAGDVNFFVAINGLEENSPSPVLFRYLDPIVTTQLVPAQGSTLGAETVVMLGMTFPASVRLECAFGSVDVPARLLNESAVECITPATEVGQVMVGLKVNGYLIRDSELPFEFTEAVRFATLMPAIGSLYGNTSITVAGSGFTLDATLLCLFGDRPVPAVYLSATSIRCVTPSHAVGEVAVSVVDGAARAVANDALAFKFAPLPELSSVFPAAGPIQGATEVEIIGSGFYTDPTAAAVCVFGEIRVEAKVNSSTVLTCTAPPSNEPTVVGVMVVFNNAEKASGAENFRYLKSTLLTSVVPASVSRSSNTPLLLTGPWFPVGANISCLFANVETAGRVLNTSAVECAAPVGVIGSIPVTLVIDGYVFPHSNIHVFVAESVVLWSADVNSGTTAGGTNITIFGSGFEANSDCRCYFDDQSSPALFISTSSVLCAAPPHSAGQVDVTVMVNGLKAVADAPIKFTYTSSLHVTSVIPSTGPLSGGNTVMVQGTGFSTESSLLCAFGTERSPATTKSDTLLECAVPPSATTGVSTVEFRVDTAGGDESLSGLFYRYLSAVQILAVEPSRGTVQGGDVVLIRGVSIPSSDDLSCLFGELKAKAVLISNTAVECTSPAATEESVVVGLVVNGFEVRNDFVKFTYHAPTTISSSSPASGAVQGNTNVTVIGTGFVPTSDISCWFGATSAPAVYVSNTTIECNSPAHAAGIVELTVTVNDVIATSESALNFHFVAAIEVAAAAPIAGKLSGGTTVHVSGTGFTAVDEGDLKCNFGENAVPALVINDSTVACISPAADAAGLVELTLSANGAKSSSGSVYHRYLEPILVDAVYPAYGSVRGGEDILVLGAGFLPMTSAKCHFGEQAVDARVLNTTAAVCVTPTVITAGAVDVKISFEGHESADAVQFSYVPAAVVSSIHPLTGSTVGATAVTVTGSGFLAAVETACVFNDAEVPAAFVSETELTCSTLSHPVGVVNFSLLTGKTAASLAAPIEFTYVAAPTVTAVSPASGGLTSGATISIAGQNFAAETMLCSFGDLTAPVVIVSATSAMCQVPDLSSLKSASVTAEIRHAGETIFSAPFDVLDVATSSATAISPRFLPLNAAGVVQVSGQQFHPSLAYTCQVDGHPVAHGTVLTDSVLACPTPAVDTAIQASLVVSQGVLGVVGSYSLAYLAAPEIVSASITAAGTIHASVESVHPEIAWQCVVNGVASHAIVVTRTEVLCHVPVTPSGGDVQLQLRAVDVPFESNAVTASSASSGRMTEGGNSACTVLPAELSSYRNDPSAPFATSCGTADNSTMSPVQKRMIDQKQWFKQSAGLPPRDMDKVHFDYANLPSSADESREVPVFSTLFADTISSSCAIDANTSCFSATLDAPLEDSSFVRASFDGNQASSDKSQQNIVVLHSVEPFIIDSVNGSWVTVTGRGFTNASQCTLGNSSALLTTFESASSLQCWLPSLNEAQQLFVELSVSTDDHLAVNSLPMVYKFLTSGELKPFASEQARVSLVASHAINVAGTFCASKEGCEILSESPAVNLTWAAFLDATEFGATNYSFSADYSTSNEQMIKRREVLSGLNNLTQLAAASIALENVAPESAPTVAQVLIMNPSKFDLSVNRTDNVVHFLGAGLSPTSEWCMQTAEVVTECFAQSTNNLVCNLPEQHAPGVFPVHILSNCSADSIVFSSNIEYYYSFSQTKAADVLTTALMDVSAWKGDHNLVSIKPLSGSVDGLTKVMISGANLQSVHSCTFKFDDQLQYTTPAQLVGVEVSCITPAVSQKGSAEVELNLYQGTTVSTGMFFKFVDEPEVSFLSTGEALDDETISVFGTRFPTNSQSFCKITFTSGQSMLTAAHTASSTMLTCLGATRDAFHGRVVTHVAVSFNGQDFIDAYGSTVLSSRDHGSQLSLAPIVTAEVLDPFGSSVRAQQLSNSLSVNSPTVTISCDEESSVIVNVPRASQTVGSTCVVNGLPAGVAKYLSATQMRCTMPVSAPGLYELTVQHPMESLLLPSLVLVQCLPRPKILTARLLPQVLRNGASELRFAGLNFHADLPVRCRLNTDWKTATTNSPYELGCNFDAQVPGMKEVSLELNGHVLVTYKLCFSVEMLAAGGSLSGPSAALTCSEQSVIRSPAPPKAKRAAIVREIRAFTPRSGLTMGKTPVEIIADGIDYGSDVSCKFGAVKVPAVVVDLGRVLCYSPPQSPHNVSLSLVSADGQWTWNGGWFFYHPVVKVLSVSPSLLDRSGGTIIVVDLQTALPDTERLYCHVHSQVLFANRIGNSTISCISPPNLVASAVTVTVGSLQEVWSNGIEVAVSDSFEESSIRPARGSLEGNTLLHVEVPASVHQMTLPACWFGLTPAAATVWSAEDANTLLCVTPPGTLGQVDIQVMDDAVENGMTFFAGTFMYEIPADVTTIVPSFVNQGESTELTVFGANIHDSPLLSCVLNGEAIVPAKWLSSQVAVCFIDKMHTVRGHGLTIQLSNNKLDLSARKEVLQVVTDNMITQVAPLTSFTSGSTEISIKFRTDYLGSLRCRFGAFEATSAYQVNSDTYTCVAPRFAAGETTLEVVDAGNYVLATKDFTYFPLPVINAAALPSVLANTPSRVVFSGENLHSSVQGRFRSAEGVIVPGKCIYEDISGELSCENVAASSNTSSLFLDLSVNGLNFAENFATVQVFEPSKVVVVDPLYASEAGGNVLHFSVDRFQAGFPTECVFTVGGVRSVGPSVLTGEVTSSCITPALPLGAVTTWSIQQADKVLFGPAELVVVAVPVVSAVSPMVLPTGVLSTIKINFLTAVFEFPPISCMFQGIPYDLKLIDSLSGICTVHAAHAEESDLSLIFQGTLLPSLHVAKLVTVDSANDFALSNLYVKSFTATNISLVSKSCNLPAVAYCSGEGASIQTALRTDCELMCTIGATQNKEILRLDMCTTHLCLEPAFSSPLNVVGSMAILAITPAKGPVQGGQQVLLYGADFEQDATLMCIFGELNAPMTVLSATRALCTAPPSMPGTYPLTIVRRGLVVSTSVASYEYLPLLSNVVVTPKAISALGGTEVVCTTQDLVAVGPYYCRFNDKYVPAHIVGPDELLCQSPSFDVATVTFALSIDNSDISSEQMLAVTKPPAVFFVDPTFFPAQHAVTVSLYLEDSAQLGALTCKVNGDLVVSKLEGSVLQCQLSGDLVAGEYTITLEQGGVEFFSLPVHARPGYGIQSVSPLATFAAVSTSVTIKVTQHMTSSEFSMCCFGEHQTPATLLSSTEWQCFTPTLQFQDLDNTHRLPVGLARAEGFCEYFGFEFAFYNAPKVLSAFPTNGSVAGGTPVTITFDRPLEMETIYCRVGLSVALGQIMHDKVQCATPDPPAGVANIEVSSNGVDFTSTGQTFEYLPIVPSYVVAGVGIEDPTASPQPVVQPVLFFIQPTVVSTLSQSTITAKGHDFRPGIACLLGAADDPNRVALPTKMISEGELQCTLPVHSPGTDYIAVQNIGSLPSESVPIEFVLDPSLNSYPETVVEPPFGPRRSETYITVYGRNLAITGTDLLCLIGEEWSYAMDVTNSSLRCIAPSSQFSGKVMVRVGHMDHSMIVGSGLFEYIEDPILFDVQPARATRGTDLLVTGVGFLRSPTLTCVLGDVAVTTTVLSNTQVLCTVPVLTAGLHSVTLNTNGQHFVRSGLSIQFLVQTELEYLWPLNGPALRGGTILSIHGHGFLDNIDMHCMVDMTLVPAIVHSEHEVQCRLPPHKPGYVNVSLIADGALLHPQEQNLQFLYAPDVSVDKITPEFGYTSGDFPVFVFGSNFVNSTSLGCKFADMKSRGLFLSNVSIVCLSPSPLGRPELARLDAIPVEVTINGLDYSESGILFAYSEPCDQGFFCAGSGRSLCPNGTYCPINSRNFTLCAPGFFQPREGQTDCVICPVGYICPDQGMSRPVNCPPGLICDSMGLRSSAKLCPNGHYCLNNTKSSTVLDFENSTQWNTDYVTGVVSFNASSIGYEYINWPAPAVGKSRPTHPPEFQCDGLVCAGGTTNVLAEAPFPCPIGHYCRAGVGTQIPMPKNFSSPQRCYDGFFCPRGSVSPEGKGPCPNGFFCPTQLDAIICPQGHYCPGVGNTAPVECYPGTYNPFEGRGNCTVCPTGYICPSWGTLLPEPCPAGFVCMALGLSYPVVLCPAGYRCGEGTLTMDPSATTKKKPLVCAEAQFCLGGVASSLNIEWIPTQPFGATQPQLCAEGTYCQAGAYLSSGSGLCFQGHYCPPDTAFPIETPVGNFASGLGSVAPTLCYPGTYAPLKAQVDCLVCPSGHTCISYGTYIPTICLEGTYRSQVDSVTCTQCPTGTYSYEVGGTDLTICLPCPKGRICGIKKMVNLKQSTECPPGYVCGYGTDRSSQFAHLTPAGFHTVPNTIPEEQYDSLCPAGFYCPRGTPTYAKNAGKCPVGSYCPAATPAAVNADTKCPKYTTSLSQSETLQSCRIAEVNVCDKLLIDETDPMEDLTYYAKFTYDLLDDTGASISFDSSVSATNPTGEVQVVKKIHPTNFTSSAPLWQNDTVEAFRSCPMYGSGVGGDKIIIVGRNFKDTKLNYCRFRSCNYANLGSHPRRCQNQITSPTGEDLRRAGNVSEATIVQRARYISPTRMECPVPEFVFESDVFVPDTAATGYSCEYVNALGESVPEGLGNYSYVRKCNGLTCADQPLPGYEYFSSLTFRCTAEEILDGICAHKPELNFMFNPCMSTEVIVEVTNDGEHYSGGDDLEPYSVLSTVRYFEHDKKIYNNFKNFTYLSTFAIYNYVHPKYFYKNPEIMDMERSYCVMPRFSEEEKREREDGYFQLKLAEVAHVNINLEHLPSNLVYDEHYRIAIFIIPSRCTVELCSSSRVRLSPEEFVPCRKPKELSYWFQQTNVPKNVRNNITIFALDDLLFKVEIHILHGLYLPYAPLFTNTTTVRISSPSRTRTATGEGIEKTKTRPLSKYISYEERNVEMQYFFVAVYYLSDVNTISQALNMPPRYKDYERGRALIMNNRSSLNNQVPLVLDEYADINLGTSFWLMPSTTSDQSKELSDAYFETFHETSYGTTEGYVFDLQKLALPYLPYFSNCDTFDSYIPIWLFLEGAECKLPDIYPKSWIRYKFPALPDLDDIKVVGPFSFFEDPIADWCERSVKCHYEEELFGQDNTPRWFEAETGTALFNIIRVPFDYYQYTGRDKTGVSQNDAGGGKAISDLQLISGDNFIAVTVDRTIGDMLPGCIVQCFARSYLLEITYFQETLHTKRIVSASLIGDLYDFNQDDSSYELQLSYYPLGFVDLVLNFAYPLSIFMIIFVFLGFLTVLVAFIGWAICRATTLLQNPPQIKIMSMLVLILPPPLAGVTMAVTAIWLLTSLGNWFINGELVTDPNSPVTSPIGEQMLDEYPLNYGDLQTIITVEEQEAARIGRIGSVFMIVGFCCFISASKMYFPKDETKRELEVAKLRTDLAHKDLWNPVQWKKANFMFCSFVFASVLVLVVELSYADIFGEFIYVIIVMLIIFGEVFKMILEWQLNDAILVAPLNCGWNFVSQLVTFGSPDFLAFLLSYFLGVAMQMFQRVFQKVYIDAVFAAGRFVVDTGIEIIRKFIPKYMNAGKGGQKAADNLDSKDYRRREVDGVAEAAEESDSVEPILDYFGDVCSDMMILVYFPFFVYLLMQYREQVQIPILYGIRQSDMMIYLVFQLFVLFAQPFADIFHHSMCELFHGWKIYEYLVYSRYRFLQRETRWKSMENSLDECIEEGLRRLDQMCFSSQYYLMLTVQVNGIIYVVFAYECWLRSGYSPFSDSAFFMLLAFLLAMYALLQWVALFLAVRLKLWKIKHENTAWHMAQREEDDLDIPAWEEIKGASTDAYLMNQRITSETFRYKFLNYNRTWLINQLPQLLTPRTMRRSRPYLINQFARIINARRDDISDDSDGDKDKKFGPVALTAPSRNIVRWWLGKARRRIKLRTVVDPLIKRARGSQCEQCLSRKQLQIEYEIDVDKMAEMYDNIYPGDEEVDQVQWKQFWINNQRYHTICLACLTRRKEIEAREAMKGAVDPSLFDDGQEEYPDWGPVFLSAASKAMLLNWYRKAQRLRAGKRGNKRKDKVLKAISDDEGEDLPKEWLHDMPAITAATKAIAVKWMRTARARLQKKHGKGAGLREAEVEAEAAGAAGETFRSGRKSKTLRK